MSNSADTNISNDFSFKEVFSLINKIKNMTRRIISLALVLTMIMPTVVFAGSHTVNNWDDYTERLKNDIMKQEESITIKFNGTEIFSTEYFARLKIADAYEDAMESIPKYLGDLNIISETTIPVLDGVLNAPLKSVTHTIKYKNSAKDFADIRKMLDEQYKIIRTKVTDYEKIRAAYDYIVGALSDVEDKEVPEIKKILSPQKDEVCPQGYNEYTVLFAMIMTDLGYDNDIATGKDGDKWNLVKVQGKWYHVDGRLESIGEDDYFLISKNTDFNWDREKHVDKLLASDKYNGNPPTVPQIKYEIELIEEDIEKTLDEIANISEEISMEQIRDTKKKFVDIEEKVKDYKERKDILKAEAIKTIGDSLKTEFDNLETSIENISDKINDKKLEIVNKAVAEAEDTFEMSDILAAKEAITMIEDKNLEDKINALGAAIEAIEKAERTRLEEDIILARKAAENTKTDTHKTKLEERINILEATIAVEKAEKTRIQEDVNIAYELVNKLKDGEAKTSLKSRIDVVKDEIAANEKEQELISKAKAAVDAAEETLRDNKSIDEIKDKIKVAEDEIKEVKTDSVRKQLQGRIANINIAIDAISSVNDAEDSVKDIPDNQSLAGVIEKAEGDVKTAEAAVKKIKDAGVRTNQQNRIKAIKVVITAIKAVEKAETSTPPKMTNITSAKKAIDKVNKEYQETVDKLNNRLNEVEAKIASSDLETKAITAVEKAEKSMKTIDIASARDAVEQLPDSPTKNKLTERIKATEAMVKVENSLTEYLKDYSEKSKEELDSAINGANGAIDKLEDGIVKNQRENRMIVIEKARLAIEAVEKVEKGETTTKEAEEVINTIADSKIKKELEKRLKDIISQKETEENNKKAIKAVDVAEKSLKDGATTSDKNIEAVRNAEEEVKKLPSGNVKKDLQAIIKDLNNAIKAKQIVENAEVKMNNNTLVVKDVTAAEKAILNIKAEYKPGLDERVKVLRDKLEENEADGIFNKAKEAVEKAEQSKLSKDITAAKKAVNLVKDEDKKKELTERIEELEITIAKEAIKKAKETELTKDITAAKKAIDEISSEDKYKKVKEDLIKEIEKLEIEIATKAVRNAEESAKQDSKSVSKDISAAEKAVDSISIKEDYREDKANLNARIKATKSYVATIKVLENAEKTRNEESKNDASRALEDFKRVVENVAEKDKTIYNEMITDIDKRIKAIENYMEDEADKVAEAQKAVEEAEKKMTVDTDPENSLIIAAQKAVDMVTDKNIRAGLQKRIDAIQVVKDAKVAVARAAAYPNEKSVKDAETALNKVDGRYRDIIEHLSEEIAKIKNQLDISKKVAEATNLVQKAVESRIAADSIKARFAVDGLKELAPDSYNRLTKILDELDESIENAEGTEKEALEEAQKALKEAFDLIDEVNIDITKIIEGKDSDEEVQKIKAAYEKVELAKNKVIKANAAVRKLTNQKDLLREIDYASGQIDLAEDNIDVKEAVRLVTIASSSVTNAKDEQEKSQARLDIAAARRAIDRIGHNDNKAIKATILNTINSIEAKLTSDNDQELIDAAVDAVNKAADILADAVRKDEVMKRQEDIDKAIFAAKLAIGWISDNNKAAKATLTSFINDIESMYKAEKEGILNEERIKNAEKAVAEAESKKGSDELESYIRVARLRVKIIKNDGPETAVKIAELNARLDALENKTGGGSESGGSGGNSGGSGNKPGSGGNSGGGNKPGGNGSNGNITPTTPLPDYKRVIGTTEPIWGETKRLKKTNPVTGISFQDITTYKINESKIKIMELSNILNTTQNVNARLVVRGKNINLDSKPYIHDRVNNNILIPIKFLGDELGFNVSLIDSPITSGTKSLLINGFVYGESKMIVMDLGSEYCYINGNLVRLSSRPIVQGGRTYIPVDFIVQYLDLTFSYYNENGNIQLILN